MNTAKLNVWKTHFFKNISENGGAMSEAISTHDKAKDIIIHSDTQKHGRIWGYTQPLKLLELIKANKGIYEVITAYPHKLYFDIDKKGDVKETFLNDIKETINKYFPNADLAVSGSITPEKVSYHIISNNYTIHNAEEREYVKQIIKHLCENVDDSFDWKVYTKNRNMKCINQSKRDGRVQEIVENEDYRRHLITCFINDYSLPFPVITNEVEETIMIAKSKKVYDIATLPKLNLVEPENFDFYSCTPLELLAMFPINKSFNHDYTHLVGRYCFYNNISLEHFLSWISKKHNPLTEEIKQKWAKQSQNEVQRQISLRMWQSKRMDIAAARVLGCAVADGHEFTSSFENPNNMLHSNGMCYLHQQIHVLLPLVVFSVRGQVVNRTQYVAPFPQCVFVTSCVGTSLG
jgi:hypothetical protein